MLHITRTPDDLTDAELDDAIWLARDTGNTELLALALAERRRRTAARAERHVPLSGPSRAGRQYIGDCSGPADARTVPFDTGVMHGPVLDCGALESAQSVAHADCGGCDNGECCGFCPCCA